MRILIIHNKYLQRGGEDTVFASEQKLLAKNGHEVDTLVFDNAGVSSIMERIKFGFKSIYNFESFRLVKEKIQEFNPDIIHVHNFFYVASPSIYYAAKSMGVPVVQTLHNFRLICPSAFLFHRGKVYEDSIKSIFPLKAIYKRVWNNSLSHTTAIVLSTGIHKLFRTFKKNVDAFIVFTEFSKSIFMNSSLGLKEKKLFIKPNFSTDFGVREGTRGDYFLYMGRLSEEKGIRTLLEGSKHYDFKLKIIGAGPLKELVQDHAAENPNIEYLGLMPQTDAIGIMQKAKALLFSSIWYEGMPMVILEAFSTGTPVISSKIGNPEFMISEGRNGLFFEPRNPFDLAETIKKLDLNKRLQKALSLGARRTYDQKYSPEINYQRLLGIYSDVLQTEMITSEVLKSDLSLQV